MFGPESSDCKFIVYLKTMDYNMDHKSIQCQLYRLYGNKGVF